MISRLRTFSQDTPSLHHITSPRRDVARYVSAGSIANSWFQGAAARDVASNVSTVVYQLRLSREREIQNVMGHAVIVKVVERPGIGQLCAVRPSPLVHPAV